MLARLTRTLARAAALLALAGAAGCDDANPVDESKPRGLEVVELTFSASKVDGDTIEDRSPVVTAEFLSDIHRELGPTFTGVELQSISLTFDPPVANAEGWSDLFQGEITVFFAPDSGGEIVVAKGTATPDFEELPLSVEATRQALSAEADILSGHFSVGLRAKSAQGAGAQFAVALTVNMTFDAF